MDPLELRRQLYGMIKEHKLEDEVWLTLSMIKVKDAIENKGGTELLLMPDALHPTKIREGMMIAVDELAELIVQFMKRQN